MRAFIRALNQPIKNKRGIALFMVLSAIGVLALLATEFTYVAQVNQRLAYNRLDEIQAFYTAKSAYKLSLIRLKAYKTVKSFVDNPNNKAFAGAVPKSLINMIWQMPFVYPIPSGLPGLTQTQKDSIETFQNSSGLAGSFSSVITSESSKYNINLLMPQFVRKVKEEKKTTTTNSNNTQTTNNDENNSENSNTNSEKKEKEAPFDKEAARKSLYTLLYQRYKDKIEHDDDFADLYRDFTTEDLTENIFAWVDPEYQSKSRFADSPVTTKRAPFFHISELFMIPPMDEELFDLFSPLLTVQTTSGINVNTIEKEMLKALLPEITDEEADKFFEYRDDPKNDNQFKKADGFFDWLKGNVAQFAGSDQAISELKDEFKAKHLTILTDESHFKVVVQAQVGQASKTLEAWVSLESDGNSTVTKTSNSETNNANNTNTNNAQQQQLFGAGGSEQAQKNSGLKISFLRIL